VKDTSKFPGLWSLLVIAEKLMMQERWLALLPVRGIPTSLLLFLSLVLAKQAIRANSTPLCGINVLFSGKRDYDILKLNRHDSFS
jgi:hypothetical protein